MRNTARIYLLICMCTATRGFTCDVRHTYADCSFKGLSDVPRLPKNITHLDLRGNLFRSLKNNTFIQLPGLKKLALDNNYISEISENAFKGLLYLEELSMSHNNLIVTTSPSFKKRIFKTISTLKVLDLSWNTMGYKHGPTTVNSTYPDEVFGDLINLREMKIDLYPISVFGKGFRRISKLETLVFQQCLAQRVSNDTFKNFQSIKCLFLRNCNLIRTPLNHAIVPSIESGAFEHFPLLRNLDLSGSLFTLPALMESLYGLRGREIDILNFYGVNNVGLIWSDKDFYVKVTQHMTRYFSSMCIKHINLGNNGIAEIEPSSLLVLKNQSCIESYLIPENNFIVPQTSELLMFLENSNNLKVIDMSYMLVKTPSPEPFYSLPFQKYCTPMERSEVINTSINKPASLSTITAKPGDTAYNFTIRCPPKLQRFRLSNIIAPFLLTSHVTFLNCSEIEILDLSSTTVSMSGFTVSGFDMIKVLNISGLDIMNVELPFLKSFRAAKHLIVRNGNLDRVFRDRSQVFDFFHDVEQLDINVNHLTSLPYEMVQNMTKLKIISLSTNSLDQFPSSLMEFDGLHSIDLRNNRITSINDQVLAWLSRPVDNETLQIFLEGNVFTCDCQNINFINWIFKTKVNVVNKESFICALKSGERLNLTRVYKDIGTLFKHCNSKYWLTFGIAGFSIISIILVLFIIAYRFRWRIIYFCYRQCKPNKHINTRDFDFDAFVAYTGDDYRWVWQRLRIKLEREFKLRICLHDREFELGETIAQNIVDFIRKSRKIVFDITPANWCEFEIEMAKLEMFQRGTPEDVIVIVNGGVTPEDMPRCIRNIWKHVTCIIFPEEENDEAYELFWSRLHRAIIS